MNMKVEAIIILFIINLSCTLPKQINDHCSKFNGALNHSLVECPPAKFMIKNNLFECYDKYYKENCKYIYTADNHTFGQKY